jgi:hypothetical protein
MAHPSATYLEYVGTSSSGGTVLGQSASELIGFYGVAPVAQRAYSSAVHATSALASSSDFGATQLAALQEIQKTLVALGVWATA